MIIVCRYCQKDVPHCPIKRMEEAGYSVYFCHTCQAEYVLREGDLMSVSLYTMINDHMYRWSVGQARSGYPFSFMAEKAFLYYVGEPGIPAERPNRKMKLLKHFNKGEFPIITPNNVNSKISFMLVYL